MNADIISWLECAIAYSGKEQLFSRLLAKHKTASAVVCSELAPDSARKELALRTLSICSDENITILTREDERFPACFVGENAPIVLYVKGDAKLLSMGSSVGIIGAREPCAYSLDVCAQFTRELAQSGKAIVSGFARGIDKCAHLTCLNSGGRTIAVLGSGIGCDYPYGSLEMQKEIAASGVVISEFTVLSKPVRSNFIKRNRLIASLCDKLLVVQASSSSGCLSTVSYMLELGKEVFVIPPHSVRDASFAGQAALIRDGARIAFEPQDIL